MVVKAKPGYKLVKSIFKKEIEIPEEWEYLHLEYLTGKNQKGAIRMGPFGSSLKKHELLDEGKIKTLWIENIVENKFSFEYKKFITEEKYKELEGFTVKPHDVLITMMGTLGKVAIVPESIGIAIISSHLLKITLDAKKMISRYLFYYLFSNITSRQLIRESRGIVMGGLNTGIIKSLLIITPSITEQQKIVSILSNVDNLIDSYGRSIESIKLLKQGLIQTLLTKGIGHKKFKKVKWLFGKEIEIPEEWDLVKFGDFSKIGRGASPRPIQDPRYFGNGRGWIRISDVSKSKKYLEKTRDYLSKEGESESVAVNEGDVIMSIAATVGRPIILKMKACIHDGFIVFAELSKEINNEFLYYLLEQLETSFSNMGQHGTQSNINSKLVSDTKFAKPSFKEQQKIASILSSVDEKINELESKKTNLESLKKGLMQNLLTGQLRVAA